MNAARKKQPHVMAGPPLATGTMSLDWHREAASDMSRKAQRLIRTALGANEAALAIAQLPEASEHIRVRKALGLAMDYLSGVDCELGVIERTALALDLKAAE